MQQFRYRHARFAVKLLVRFSDANDTYDVRCTNISATGLSLDLSGASAHGCRGRVVLRCQDREIELNARIVHRGSHSTGLEFVYASASERDDIRQLITSIAAIGHHEGITLVPKH